MLYEMATGRVPFERKTALDTMHAIVYDPLPQELLAAAVPPELTRLIEKATRKDSNERYQSAKDMAVDLRRMQRDTEANDVRVLGTQARWPGWRVAVAAVVLGLALLAVAGTLWLRRVPLQQEAVADAGDILARKSRLVVLPFENLTRQPADDWLAGGFSDSLTFGLQKIDALILVIDRVLSLAPTVVNRLDVAFSYFECGYFNRGAVHLDRASARNRRAPSGSPRRRSSHRSSRMQRCGPFWLSTA